MLHKKSLNDIAEFALKIRIGIIEEIKARGAGHLGGSLSIADALAVLYGGVMHVDPQKPKMESRDKLVCSKGHAGPAVYAALALRGFFPYDELKTLNQPGTRLPSHCDHNKTPGIDMTTGSLGQGASLAAGLALGDRLKGLDCRTYLIIGDGEANEGQVWEAAMFTAAKKLNRLVWLIDNNKKQLDGWTVEVNNPFDFEEKFRAFGFEAVTVDGHDLGALRTVLSKRELDRPLAVVLDTVKGKGISEVETTVSNHSMSPSAETCDRWLAQLRGELEQLQRGGGVQ